MMNSPGGGISDGRRSGEAARGPCNSVGEEVSGIAAAFVAVVVVVVVSVSAGAGVADDGPDEGPVGDGGATPTRAVFDHGRLRVARLAALAAVVTVALPFSRTDTAWPAGLPSPPCLPVLVLVPSWLSAKMRIGAVLGRCSGGRMWYGSGPCAGERRGT